jgi:hypothetical protein
VRLDSGAPPEVLRGKGTQCTNVIYYQNMRSDQKKLFAQNEQAPPYIAVPMMQPPIPSPDASKVPIPEEEEEDGVDNESLARERGLTLNAEPIMKNYMDKFFNQTVFSDFKKDNTEVTQAIANHMKVDLSTKEKLGNFLEHTPNNAEVIAFIQAHFNTTTVPMVKNICKNIGDFFPSLSPLTTAPHHSLNWLAAEQRLHQKEVSRCQIVLLGFPKGMPPEARHRCVTFTIINVRDLAQPMLEVKIAASDAEIQCEPERALQLLACLPTTVATGKNTSRISRC